MANRISIRSGSNTPSSSDLLDKELGYDSDNKILYINNGGEIEEIGNAIKAHAPTHATGGTDPITPNSIGAATTSHTHDLRYYTETETNDLLAEKADKIIPAIEGNLAGLDTSGNLADSGVAPSSLATKAVPAVAGNLAGLNASGNLTDSGKTITDFLPNKNLLKNGYFYNAKNTQGLAVYIYDGGTIDSWNSYLVSVVILTSGLGLSARTGTDARLWQTITGLDITKTYTLSILINNTVYSVTGTPATVATSVIIPGKAYISLTTAGDDVCVMLGVNQGATLSTVKAMKLELGSVSTLVSTDANGDVVDNSKQIADIFNLVYPVGSIYISVAATSPTLLFGGTWTAFGTGKTLVGVDTGQTEFNTVQKTGGSKYLQSHSHLLKIPSNAGGGGLPGGYGLVYTAGQRFPTSWANGVDGGGEHTGFGLGLTGDGNAQNLQPYITVYMWLRTA